MGSRDPAPESWLKDYGVDTPYHGISGVPTVQAKENPRRDDARRGLSKRVTTRVRLEVNVDAYVTRHTHIELLRRIRAIDAATEAGF